MNTNTNELAWCAGFFDGEGNIRWNMGKQFGCMRLQIAQIDKFVLERFRNAVGVGRIYGPYNQKSRSTNSKPYWVFAVASNQTLLVYELLKPYLSPVKISQAEDTIKLWKKYKNRIKQKPGPRAS